MQTLLMLVSPVSSFIVSLRFYKSSISMFFILVFSYYFGSHFWMGNDATVHYMSMLSYFVGHDLSEILSNPAVMIDSSEPYVITLKYVLSRFTSSPTVFGGVIASLYALILLHFLSQFSKFYKHSTSTICCLFLVTTLFIVEFTWYQGVRFWPGVLFFAGFYLRYLNTRKWIFFAISLLCPLFHFALYALDAAVLFSFLLKKSGKTITLAFIIISFVVKTLSIDFIPILLKSIPVLGDILSSALTSQRLREDLLQTMENIRENGNVVYMHRSDILAIFGLLIWGYFSTQHVKYDKLYLPLIYLAASLLIFANFEYVDITFYDRFYKIANLIFYTFLTVTAYQNYHLIRRHSVVMIILILLPLCFALATDIVTFRDYLFKPELWFGNFFIDWSGGMDEDILRYHWFV